MFFAEPVFFQALVTCHPVFDCVYNHLQCLLPDCIITIINVIPLICIYSFTYAHMCKDITVDSSALAN